ncbi:uncharacterized protein LOC132356951 [Balaenoptera ricei]|uniref:uncharacterized protein LOC132356951 n=1 Tax=Balaenoptera ricei TaxID=2746895 RepID=UPI0028BDAFF8|nr:uncharacterized protein LOC132356951 [Balaenoptera ricei]XP_059766188.1 uncharacterized protein LOC132356951 [Balaenoptera ricei]
MQWARAPPWTPTNPSAMANSLHQITAAPAPPLSAPLTPLVARQLLPALPPTTSPHTPSPTHHLLAIRSGPCKPGAPPMLRDQTASLTSPHRGVLPRAPSEPGALASCTPDAESTRLAPAHPGAGAPFLPRASATPTPRPGGSSPNAYRTRARESSPSTRACARSSSAFLPPHAAAVSPRLVSRPGEGARESSPSTRACARSSSAFLPPHAAAVSPRLVSRPGEGEWPARRVLPTPTASRPLLWPPKPAPPAQEEALRSGPPHA